MSMYFGGRKVKELYYEGRKIREAWYGGQRVYAAGKPSKPTEVVPAFSYFGAQDWLREKLVEYGTTYDSVTELPFDLDT